ncbi:carbohydrate ABC transporter permease [Promicromonospora thailandica]|uniref:Alpha-glucoside transport system permease protein n=1 Tax=Promicromonospora thailandica TaxID=765201 RepID=A0A9X2JUT2_9MICO|nr:sugar ABC transporter permease [Promicromonospora thailandica]MCP2263373.1 alpha-glucoside transport system permease protein [Promicromonospora thailandica]BFF19471.1 sugar ABC transporter permease [Promicromonospora thailandica]
MDWLLNAGDDPAHKFLLMIIAIVLFVAVMALILFVVDKPRNPSKWFIAGGFVGPALLLLAAGLLYPAIGTIVNSFQRRNSSEFVGFDNYARAFSDPAFLLVLGNTALWVLVAPALATFIGLVYAVVVDHSRFEKFAKALVFLPMAISMVGASIIWRFVYEYKPDQPGIEQTGLLNQLIVWLGGSPVQFLLERPGNTFLLMVVLIWIQTGFSMTLLSASIRAIPTDIVEAARLDGLSGFGMFWRITIPSIRPALVVVLTTIAMTTLKVFDIVRTMTAGRYGTSVVANEFYEQSFRQNNAGLGAALAVLLFIIVIPVIIYNVRQMRLAEEVR